jgi:hypothetical protein
MFSLLRFWSGCLLAIMADPACSPECAIDTQRSCNPCPALQRQRAESLPEGKDQRVQAAGRVSMTFLGELYPLPGVANSPIMSTYYLTQLKDLFYGN